VAVGFGSFNAVVSSSHSLNNELARPWEEVEAASFEVLPWHMFSDGEHQPRTGAASFQGRDTNSAHSRYETGAIPTSSTAFGILNEGGKECILSGDG
jgi:hypothetical protein